MMPMKAPTTLAENKYLSLELLVMLRMNKKFIQFMRENCPHVAGEKFAMDTIFKEEDNVKVEAQKLQLCFQNKKRCLIGMATGKLTWWSCVICSKLSTDVRTAAWITQKSSV